ncbi:MAG: methionyl-tRNA formyltransferase [Planctomycetota bacterium]|nr:methionyl-tRNA formyltransferase [Planctomycetota bacterium]MDI6787016.1 methionyl-tRNA formyltransferase [Planctomycetota bacterium]
MKLIFAGSSEFALPPLKTLATQSEHPLIAVITQPDTRKGRGLTRTGSPVKQFAIKHSLPLRRDAAPFGGEPRPAGRGEGMVLLDPFEIWQPKSINELSFINKLKKSGVDLIIVSAYGQKLSKEILELPAKGCINIHPSLLPKYRGSAPVNYAILNGDTKTGITIIKMVEKMDSGHILKQVVVDIKKDENALDLQVRLAKESAEIILEVLREINRGTIQSTEQDETKATYAFKLNKRDGEIDWNKNPLQIVNQIRAMYPWPSTFTFWHRSGKPPLKIDILQARIYNLNSTVPFPHTPGSVLNITQKELIIACGAAAESPDVTSGGGQGASESGRGLALSEAKGIIINKLKPAGSRILSASEFVNGYRLKIGDKFGRQS